MKMTNPHLIARMLRMSADMIDNGKCGLDEEEMVSVASIIFHRKMSIEQCCTHYGVRKSTIIKWQSIGKFPCFRQDSGGNDFVWLDEADEYINKWELEHD